MKFFSFSLCLFSLIFALSIQILKNNKLRNLDYEKNIIEIEILSDTEGDVSFIKNTFLENIEKIILNGEEMIEKKSSTTMNANENYNIKIQFKNDFNDSCASMFYNLNKIKKIKFKNFNGCNDTREMFRYCSSLESLDLSSFNTSKVTNMDSMFAECSSLESLGLSSFNTSSVVSFGQMFYGCSSLESLDLSSFNDSSVISMYKMFIGCYSLSELILSSLFTMEKVKSYKPMFSNFYFNVNQNGANLKDDIKNSINETNSRDLKKNLILITIRTEESKENLKFINYNENIQNIILLQNDGKIDYTNNINVGVGMTIIKLLFPEDSNKISCDELFKNIPEIKKVVFKNFDLCNSAREMFSNCSSLEKLNLKSFNTSEITNMTGMFSGCSNLETLGVSSFDITKSENNDNMFCNCNKLNDLDKNSFGRTSFKCEDCNTTTPFW